LTNEKPFVVLIGADTFPPDVNGAARFGERLAAGLARRGIEVHVVAPATSEVHGNFRENHDGTPIIVHRLKSHRFPGHKTLRYVNPLNLRSKTDRILRQVKPDVVHVQSHLNIGRQLSKGAKKRGITLVATNHIMPENLIKYTVGTPEWIEKPFAKFAWWDAKNVLKLADAITTPTKRAANLLESKTGLTGVYAISCGIDATAYADAPPATNKPATLLFVGRLDHEKRIHVLLKAVSLLDPKFDVKVELVGDGSERQPLEAYAEELGIRDKINFLGPVSDAELMQALHRSSIFVMPSIAELQSIATMEAMASGRPVVAADAMALPHLVHSGDNGYLFKADDSKDFAKQLTKVLEADKVEFDRMVNNSLHLIQAHDINKTLDIFEQLYRGQKPDGTTADNEDAYNSPIGNRALGRAMREARERLNDARDGVIERLDEMGEKVVERFEDIRYDVRSNTKRINRKIQRGMKRTIERMRREG
jgi:glycosyltransferase involved in cell wall biosynthesis